MAEKRVSVRFSAQGGARVIQEMEGIGRAGTQAMRQIDTSAAITNARLQGLGRLSPQARNNMRNFAMQLNQVGQQGAITGNYMQALSFQLPDMMLGFGTLGVAIGAVSAVLGPMVLEWFRAGEAGEARTEDVDALAEAMKLLSQAEEAATRPISELSEEYAGNARRARELFEIERQMAEFRARNALTGVAGGLTRNFGFSARDLVDVDGIREGEAAIGALIDRILELDEQSQNLANTAAQQAALDRQITGLLDRAAALEEVNEDIADLARRLSIPTEEARELAAMFAELGQAAGPQDQFEILSQLASAIAQATDNLGAADEETQALYESLLEAAKSALDLAALSGDVNFDQGVVSAGQLAERLGVALDVATRLAAMDVAPAQGTAGPNALDEEDPRRAGFLRPIFDGPTRVVTRWTPPPAPRASGGRSGGGGAAEMRDTSAAAQMVDRVLRQAELAAVGFEEAMAVLDARLDSGQIDMETYARGVELLQEQFEQFDSSRMEKALDGIADALARTLVYGEDLGEGLRAVFQQIAYDLVSSGIRELLGSLFTPRGGGGGGGFLGALLSGFRGLFADGGRLRPGEWGIAGEAGPEIVTGPAEIIPARAMHRGATEVIVRLDVPEGVTVGEARQIAGEVAVRVTAASAAQTRRALPSALDEIRARGR